MAQPIKTDIAIYGAGIAGLWLFNRLRAAGYDALLLEKNHIGGGQTIASQGIIHSGLKYAFAGKINKLAQSISAMPDLWRSALMGQGPVDLSAAQVNAASQYLLIPGGFMGGLIKLVTQQALGNNVHEVAKADWPEEISTSGFRGSVVFMDEPVLHIPSVIRALADPYRDAVRQYNGDTPIEAALHIYTAAGGNHEIARAKQHDKGLETQGRPLLMGMMKHAPYPLYAHLVGNSDKPVATITTHRCADGELIWYLGGAAAERAKDANPQDVYDAVRAGFKKYLPNLDLSRAQWATLPIDRIEGKSSTDGWLPDTPTIHVAGNHIYCWPTKLTFAPLLADKIWPLIEKSGIKQTSRPNDYSALHSAQYASAPWDMAKWT